MAEISTIFARRTGIVVASVLLAISVGSTPRAARAEGASTAQPGAPVDEAMARYKRALDLFNDGSYDAALLEFRRAYELAPNYRVLYNTALVDVQLNDYAAALDAFEKYLAEGGAEVPAARRDEVMREIARLSPRVATLLVTTDVPQAEVSVDDLSIGKTPFSKPVRINAGRRHVSVAAAGRIPQSRVVEAAGGDALKLEVELLTPRQDAAPDVPLSTAPLTSAPNAEASHTPWLAWTLTGALAAGTAVTGVLALKAHSDQDALKGRFDTTRGELDAADRKVRHLALATDVLLGATAVVGGISLYLTLRSPTSEHAASREARLQIRPGSVAAVLPF